MHTQTHTPGKWQLDYSDWPLIINGPEDNQTKADCIAVVGCAERGKAYDYPKAEAYSNAAFIVRACNAHDELVAVAKSALAHLEQWHSGEFEAEKAVARAALSKAQEGEV